MLVNVIFVVVVIVVVVGLVIWIAIVSRRAKANAAASDARLAVQLQAAAQDLPATKAFADETPAERSAAVVEAGTDPDLVPEDATPPATKATRLAELADLHTKGLISDDELAAARAKILAE